MWQRLLGQRLVDFVQTVSQILEARDQLLNQLFAGVDHVLVLVLILVLVFLFFFFLAAAVAAAVRLLPIIRLCWRSTFWSACGCGRCASVCVLLLPLDMDLRFFLGASFWEVRLADDDCACGISLSGEAADADADEDEEEAAGA